MYIVAVGGVQGGYEEEKLLELVNVAKTHNCKTVLIERNFGSGAHCSMLKPLFAKEWPVEIEEVWETGQKELRIIDLIEPVLTSHRLIISPSVIREDSRSVAVYAKDISQTYSLLYQMAMITRDKGCLRHDDRLDALAGAIRHIVEGIDYDTQSIIDARKTQEHIDFVKAWTGQSGRNTYLTGEIQENHKHSFRNTATRGQNRFK